MLDLYVSQHALANSATLNYVSTIIDKLAEELSIVAHDPDVQALITKIGALPVKSPSPDELQKFLASEVKRWGELIERSGAARSL